VIYALGKSPLGPVVRFTKKAPLAIAKSSSEADCMVKELGERVGCKLRVVELSTVNGLYEVGYLDPDLVDATKHGFRYVILAEWI